MAIFSSRFTGRPRLQARLILAGLALAILAGLAVSFMAPAATDAGPAESRGDHALYQNIVDRMKAGESYYDVAADELREGGYALRPVFNFRLPTLAAMLAVLPLWAGPVVLGLIAAAALAAWTARFWRAGANLPRTAAVGAILFTGVGPAFAGSALVFHEVWAGLLVALALAVHDGKRWAWSVAFGLAAVLVRELALPLPLVMMVMAFRERRMAEAGAWLGVIAVFAVFFGVHAMLASQQLTPADGQNSWTSMGGLGFLLSTLRWNAMLLTGPVWINAILLPLAVLGLAGWNNRLGARAAALVCLWLAAFMVVGRPDNHYWGLIYAPLLALGATLCLPSLVALAKSAAPVASADPKPSVA